MLRIVVVWMLVHVNLLRNGFPLLRLQSGCLVVFHMHCTAFELLLFLGMTCSYFCRANTAPYFCSQYLNSFAILACISTPRYTLFRKGYWMQFLFFCAILDSPHSLARRSSSSILNLANAVIYIQNGVVAGFLAPQVMEFY